jgi:hypothetical protein
MQAALGMNEIGAKSGLQPVLKLLYSCALVR